MSEVQENELLLLIKELVDKVKSLEVAVYNKDNILMKSGFVVANTPTPSMAVEGNPISDNIANMDWKEINAMVSKLEGGY